MSGDPQLDRKYLDRMFGGSALTPPSTYYVALTTTVPTDQTPGAEPSLSIWTNYVRIAVPNDTAHWTTAVTSAVPAMSGLIRSHKTNAQEITWPQAVMTAGITVAGFELYDAITGGTRWEWGIAGTSLSITPSAVVGITNGMAPTIKIGSLLIAKD